MAYKLVSAKCVPLTRELIEQHFSMDPSPTERPLDPSRLRYLHEKAEANQLINFHWASAQLDAKIIRMNGHHSSTMLHERDGQVPKGLYVHQDGYEVEHKTDLALLFRQFDPRKSSRSMLDISGAYQGLYEDLQGVDNRIAKLAVEGIAFYEKHLIGSRVKLGEDQYTLFDQLLHHPFICWVGDLYNIKTPELRVVPVASAIYATFSANENEARVFWDQVARGGVEFDDSAPSTLLDSWLKMIKSPDGKRKWKPKPLEYYQGCIYAWNAYRQEKMIKEIRPRVDKEVLEPVG